MEDIQYIMVTKFNRHWDNILNSTTKYTAWGIKSELLKRGPWPANASTLFVKLNDANEYEKCWRGLSSNFLLEGDAVRFDVSQLQEIQRPEQYKSYGNGWHLNPHYTSVQKATPPRPTTTAPSGKFIPPFFSEMGSCDWPTFEADCFYLLKLLGIQEIHQYPHGNNQGKADGFFRFGTLSVIYDATLNGDLSVKNVQIANYASQLSSGTIQIDKHTYTMDGVKQVWIITRSNRTQLIGNINNVAIKEVPYTTLIDMYKERLENNWASRELFNRLNDIK